MAMVVASASVAARRKDSAGALLGHELDRFNSCL
jgi:hypothetical protein